MPPACTPTDCVEVEGRLLCARDGFSDGCAEYAKKPYTCAAHPRLTLALTLALALASTLALTMTLTLTVTLTLSLTLTLTFALTPTLTLSLASP